MEQNFNEQEYIQGYNHAALISMFRPDVLLTIVKENNPENDYFDGFFSAKEQWELDRKQEQEQLEELYNLRDSERNQERSLER
jgi:hypothetical protein